MVWPGAEFFLSFLVATCSLVALTAAKKGEGADYYGTLGVKRNADAVAIKKAYRELSLKYHPDKCVSEEMTQDECQAKFIEVSTAYEVLNDDEKRKIYNQHGEEGLKEGHQNQDQAKAMFRQFFGREPDGNVRIVNQGGRMMFMEEGEPGPKENMYDDTNATELTEDVYKAYINDRDKPWFVFFYKPNDDDCREMRPEIVKFADIFRDFLQVGVVNCRQQRSICSGASINTFPAVRWFPADKKESPEVYEGQYTSKELGKWANDNLPNHVTIIEDKHALKKWLDGATGPPVMLFTDKSSTPPMWKALSAEFNNRASLAIVLRCDKHGVFKTQLQQVYDVRIPAVIRLDPLHDIGKIAEKFESQLRMQVLTLWLQKVVAVGRKAGPVATFKEWSKERFDAGDCAPTDGQFCFLWLKAGADTNVEEAMKKLAFKYRTDPIKMMWVNVELNPQLLDAFGLENADASDFFVAFRPKRSKFKVHEGELKFEALDSFVDGTLNGGPLTGKVKSQHLEL